jgi:hypothetical protein
MPDAALPLTDCPARRYTSSIALMCGHRRCNQDVLPAPIRLTATSTSAQRRRPFWRLTTFVSRGHRSSAYRLSQLHMPGFPTHWTNASPTTLRSAQASDPIASLRGPRPQHHLPSTRDQRRIIKGSSVSDSIRWYKARRSGYGLRSETVFSSISRSRNILPRINTVVHITTIRRYCVTT